MTLELSTTLYRPLGLNELKLIFESVYKKFPPRLYWQSIFYPVTNFAYAEQITREWNVVSNGNHCGFVTAFDVKSEYVSKFQIQNVGGGIHNELWVPAEELEEFNAHIVGDIRVVASRYAEPYQGVTIETGELKGKNIREQFEFIESVGMQVDRINQIMQENEYVFLTNLGYWNKYFKDKKETLELLKQVWSLSKPMQAQNIY